jgi:hypothetical protein
MPSDNRNLNYQSSLHYDHANAKFDHHLPPFIGGETCLERLVVAMKDVLEWRLSWSFVCPMVSQYALLDVSHPNQRILSTYKTNQQ